VRERPHWFPPTPPTVPLVPCELAEWLVWSNCHGAWWNSNGEGYTSSVDHAGRFTFERARRASTMRSWGKGERPPEVMVLAPEARR